MGAKPLVPHCPGKECRDKLSMHNFWTHRKAGEPLTPFERAVLIATGKPRYTIPTTPPPRPGVPMPVYPPQQRVRKVSSGRTLTQTLLRCPECSREFWSTQD